MTFRPFPGLRRALAVLAGMLLVLAACGDDSGGSGPELSEEDFVAAYSAICIGVDEDINALEPESLEAAKEASSTASDIIEEAVAEMRALRPPSDIANDVERGTDALAQTSGVFDKLSSAESEDEFIDGGSEIDDLRAEAEDALGPLGIECEPDSDGGGDGSSDGTESDEG